MRIKHSLSRMLFVSCVALGALLSTPMLAHAADVRFSLEWLYGGGHAGFYVAQDKGFYADHGLKVDIERGYGSADTIKPAQVTRK